MNLRSLLFPLGSVAFSLLQAMPATYAQVPTADDQTEKIRAALLKPAGWDVDWSGPRGGTGTGEWTFVARGEKLFAKLNNITYKETCEREVTIASNVVKLDGCRDPNISLRFYPNDLEYPFKGESPRSYSFRLKAK